MGKVLAVVLWAGIPLCWQPLWGQAPGAGIKAGSDTKQQTGLATDKASAVQRGTKDAPFVVDTKGHQNTKEEIAQDEKEKNQADTFNRWMLRFTGAAAGFTGLLVIIGGLGIWAALRTLRAIEDQGKHMERQADLLQASMTQWVSVSNWEVNYPEPTSLGGNGQLSVTFQLLNESQFPLTAQADFRFFGDLPNAAHFHPREFPLFPNNPFSVSFELHVTDKQFEEYADGSLRISVYCDIVHNGVANQRNPLMEIRGNLICGSNKPAYLELETLRMKPMDTHGDEQSKNQGQSPN